jgi:transporter family-2 protein
MLWWIVLACLLGAAACLQGATNGDLAGRVGLPAAVVVTSVVVLSVSAVWWLAARAAAPANGPPAAWPPAGQFWLYLGGVYGLVILVIAAFLFPRLGAGPTTAIMVAAQLLTALALDQLGWPGARLDVTPMRVCGALLLVAGAVLVLWPRLRA